jgi:D-hydroxyproline dehydrogenase subunit alpha
VTSLSGFQTGQPLPAQATTDVAVVGAGPAGLAAAVALAESGLSVTLIDEQAVAGGQYLTRRTMPARRAGSAERQGYVLRQRVAQLPVAWTPETLVWHIDRDRTLHLYRGRRTGLLQAQAVVLACGAREQSVPFPGWTLPGVMTVGAAQLLAKRHDRLPGKRVLLAGSGPLLLAAASELVHLGAQVVAVLEASDPSRWLRHSTAAWGQWDRFGEGLRYLRTLQRRRIPYRFGRAVTAAHGDRRLQSVDIARLSSGGSPIAESTERLEVDTLCISFGLVPNIELAQLAGADLTFDPALGGWTPRLNRLFQTTVPGIFVAGEMAAVAGASLAILTGRLAGLCAAAYVGRLSESRLERELEASARHRHQQAQFGRMVNTLFAPPPGIWSITTDETIVCRCEEVKAGDVRQALAAGVNSLDALKTWSRAGQGPCQGRTCGPILAQLMAAHHRSPVAAAGPFSVRPPVKPVPLAALAAASHETGSVA